MTIHTNKILDRLKKIEFEAAEIRQLLFCPEGVQITAINREDISYVEYWDGENKPIIMFYSKEKSEAKLIDGYICQATGMIPPSYCGNKKVEIHTDLMLDDFSLGTLAGMQIFDIELKYPSDNLVEHIKGRHDTHNYLSKLKDLQNTNSQSTRVYRDQ